jgi:hypothetical protein
VAPGGAVIAGRAALGDRALTHLAQFLGARETFIGAAFGQQRVRHVGMAGGAGGLEHRRLVGREAEPGEALQDDVHGLLGAALAVGVLDAQEEGAAMVAGEEVVEQGGAGAADMEQAGGAGGEAGSDGHAGGVKRFFFEKKNQKTFMSSLGERQPPAE